jgi:hypothetical protein
MEEMQSKVGEILEKSYYCFEREDQIRRQAQVRMSNTATLLFPNPVTSYKFALQWETYKGNQRMSVLPDDTHG